MLHRQLKWWLALFSPARLASCSHGGSASTTPYASDTSYRLDRWRYVGRHSGGELVATMAPDMADPAAAYVVLAPGGRSWYMAYRYVADCLFLTVSLLASRLPLPQMPVEGHLVTTQGQVTRVYHWRHGMGVVIQAQQVVNDRLFVTMQQQQAILPGDLIRVSGLWRPDPAYGPFASKLIATKADILTPRLQGCKAGPGRPWIA